jgi:hypothetical protein
MRTALTVTLPLLLSLCPARESSLHAAAAPSQRTAPTTVDEVLVRYVEALGGREALASHTSRSAYGEWENVTRRVRFPIEVHASAPDRWVELLDAAENEGVTGRGYDGAVGWSSNLTETGLRRLTGAELEARRREAVFDRPLRLRDLYAELVLGEVATHDGVELVAVVATPAVGRPETWYFETGSGLLVRRDLVLDGPMGLWPVSERYFDYREVDGIRYPFRIRAEASVTTEVRLREIRHDTAISESRFAPPAAGSRRNARPQ